ncbi:MAG: hypothetical protein PHS41_11910 [Victivallaceae bacterium]|nr:hypothetical protein [Victivallaceae bacterium]
MKKVLFSLILGAFATFAAGEVYLLGPQRSGGPGKNDGTFPSLEADSILEEPVLINTVRTTSRTALLRISYAELARLLGQYRHGKVKIGPDAMRVEFPIDNGKRIRRILFVRAGHEDEQNTLCFELELPEKLPNNPPWPSELPLPPGAIPVESVAFPERGLIYGSFRHAGRPIAALRSAEGFFRNRDFQPLSGEAGGPEGRGELFFRAKPRAIAWISIADDGSGSVCIRGKQ